MSATRTRWAAIGAAVAVTLGAGGVGLVNAQVDSGERTVLIPIEPCRLLDTRADSKVGDATTLQPDSAIVLQARGEQGNCDLPDGLTALSLNVTAAEASDPTNLRIYPTPDDDSVPLAANLNPYPGLPREFNTVVTDVNEDGEFSVYNRFGTVELVIDVVGYYDDHTHDDRYYTEDEIDSVLPAVVYENIEGDVADIGTADAILTAEMTAPSAGTVLAESVVSANPGGLLFGCSLSTDTSMNAATEQGTNANALVELSTMGAFQVAAGDVLSVNLVCETTGGSTTATNPQLSLMFVADVPTTTTTTTTTTTVAVP